MLIITAIVVAFLMVGVSYAVDVSYWFVHHRHLQTEADAAALAAGDSFQFPCDSTAIANVVHQYDGTTVSSGGYNQQVPESPQPAPSQHNLFSQINQANFYGQQKPNDTGLSGNPCNASDNSMIDVKLTETNLPALLPYVSPKFINAQARVQIQQEGAGAQNLPLAIPSPAPRTMTATLIDENNGNQAIGAPFTMSSPDGVNWTSNSSQTITFSSSGSDVGLLVTTGGGTSCGSQLQCYDSNSPNHGIAYVRSWANSGTPGVGSPPAAPQYQDVTVAPTASGGCPQTNGTFSNFISVSTPCTVQLNVTALFATTAACGNTPNIGLNLSVTDSSGGTQTPAMTCKSATTFIGAPCDTTSCVQTTWTSAPVNIGADNPDGPMTFSLKWSQQFGPVPSGASSNSGQNGTCTSAKPCTAASGTTVQRTFLGAYDTNTALNSRSGPILAANLLDGNNKEIQSLARGTQVSGVTVNVNTLNLNFQQQDQNSPIVAGTPYVLHVGNANQATYSITCGNNGASTFITDMAIGCPTVFAKTTAPASICQNPPPGPPVCVTQNPGNGKKVAAGIDCRVNGTIDYTTNPPTCNPSSVCASPNHWTGANTLKQVMNQSPPDPRLVHLLIVDNAAWVGVTGSSTQTPVRDFGTFYLTGWSAGKGNGQGADPCPTTNYGGPGGPGQLAYTTDDDPGSASNVLLGHFVQDNVPGGIPNGTACVANTFGNCTPVLIK